MLSSWRHFRRRNRYAPVTEESLAKESKLLEKHYDHYFDYKIINNNNTDTIVQLESAIEDVCSTSQWVPVSWVY
ncbi:hypothetical protein DPMN_079379 [Dreissena polymorpha]|uniref:Guanylate kinase-like domain-containing protein n=1 Tax=Dreissena polymorpha TaxID=45954 RepID=A0A9D3YUD1_DREPO|nr:hypothetical protein DPMN_079379 [Dreissena polymorpha]